MLPRPLLRLVGVLALSAAQAAPAQPLPPRVDDPAELDRVRLRGLPVGAEAWRTPGPHELGWYIAYDPTPLTVDDPEFRLRLLNGGRPVRLVRPNGCDAAHVVLSLTLPDGSTRRQTLENPRSAFFVHATSRNQRSIPPGGVAARLDFRLREHFGALEPGEHVLRIDIETSVPLERARDGFVIAETLVLAPPPLRFAVVDRPVPAGVGPGEHPITTLPRSKNDEIGGRIRGFLVNPLDVPLRIRANRGQDPARPATAEDPAGMSNAIERWTDSGWVRDARVGFCGVGVGEAEAPPGEPLFVSLVSPGIHGRSPGVYRCVVTALTPSGGEVEFATPPIAVGAGEP